MLQTFCGLESSTHCAVEATVCSFFYIFLWMKTLTSCMEPPLDNREGLGLRLQMRKNKKDKIVKTSSTKVAGLVETMHTCHIGGTAELWFLHCSPPDRWGMLQGWHRGHTGCNYSATHTLGLGWWHHTGYRTHTCRTQRRQRSFYPGYIKEDNTN